eukprot:GCRY01002368.1.p1 GENE.GCRY01002368.1~~GCRY01002368.1.p1  ORF type:complete len:265 (-),score=47.47 GCRY01002368.1:356-1150(-)
MSVHIDSLCSAALLTLFSGLSTSLGAFVVILFHDKSVRKLGHLLGFSVGVMLYISFVDLLEDSIHEIGFNLANIAFFLGMLFFAFVCQFIPEPDLEGFRKKNDDAASNAELLHAGFVTAIGISLHNFPEGIAVFIAALKGMDVGVSLAVAIALHNIPEGMAVASPVYYSTKSKWKAFQYASLSGLCEPLAGLLVGMTTAQYLTPTVISMMLAAVAGIMVYICLKELIPTALRYVSSNELAISMFFGMVAIWISLSLLRHSNSEH